MLKIISIVAMAVFCFSACAPALVNIDHVGQGIGAPLASSIGEIFFEREVMTGEDNGMGYIYNGQAYRFELVVRAATSEKLVLDYAEYMKPPASVYGGYKVDAAWLRKPAFDKTMEFDLKESKKVFYKNFEFEIGEVTGGHIAYQRVK